jgi:hypothetical protein
MCSTPTPMAQPERPTVAAVISPLGGSPGPLTAATAARSWMFGSGGSTSVWTARFAAIGDATTAHTNVRVRIYDNASLLTTLGPSATTGGSFRDATYTEYTAANWPASNTLATGLVFASAIFKIRIDSSDDNGVIAHLYMTRTSSDTVSWLPVTQVATGPTSFYVAAGMTPPDKV